jgi:DNA-binding transcriptional LysR family regulator
VDFRNRYPKVNLDINSCAFHSLEHELKGGIMDLAFLLAESVNARDLKSEVLGFAELAIVASADHPLAGSSGMTIHDLEGECIILPKQDCSYRTTFEQMLSEERVKGTSIIEMKTIEAIKRCVIKGVGITIMPEISVRDDIHDTRLVVLPWPAQRMETAILMIWHKDKWISPTLQAFMNLARESIPAHLAGCTG